MPATIRQGITPGRPGGPSTPILQGSFAAQAFAVGSVLVDSGAGELQRGAADLTSGIVGVAVDAGAAAASTGAFIPAFTSVLFAAYLEDFAAGTSHVSVATDRYQSFALQRDTTDDRWMLDENDVANPAAVLLRFIDDVGTAPARVLFSFLNSVTIWA